MSVVLRKEDMVGSAMTELCPIIGRSLVLRKEDMVGSPVKDISCCGGVSGAQERTYGR